MKSRFRALLWEQWLNSRLPLACMGLVTVLASLVGAMIIDMDRLASKEELAIMFRLLAFCILPIAFVAGTVRDIRLDFPRRLFTLPVSSAQLFWGQWSFKMLVALACGLMVGVLQYLLCGWSESVYVPTLIFAIIVSLGQMLACFSTAFGAMRAVLVFILLSIGTILLLRATEPTSPTQIRQTELERNLKEIQHRGSGSESANQRGRGRTPAPPPLNPPREAEKTAPPREQNAFEQRHAARLLRESQTPEAQPPPKVNPDLWHWLWLAAFVGILPGSALISWWVTARTRSGMLRGRIPFLDSEVAIGRKTLGRFKTPQAAQRWFEWRNTLQYGLWASAVFGALAALVNAVSRERIGWILLFLFPYFQIAVVFGLGYYLTVGTARNRSFIFTKPMRTAALANARIDAGLLYTIIITGLWLIGILLVDTGHEPGGISSEIMHSLAFLCAAGVFSILLLGREIIALGAITELAILVVAFPLGLVAMKLGMSEELSPEAGLGLLFAVLLGLWFAVKRMKLPGAMCVQWTLVGTVMGVLLGLGIRISGTDSLEWLLDHSSREPIVGITPLVLLPFSIAAGIYAEARARRIVPMKFFTHPVAILLLGALGCTFVPFALKEYFQWPSDSITGMYFLGCACVAVFPWLPLFTQWQRHR